MGRNFPYTIENIEILDAGAEGKAIARHNNKVIFVPYAAPGDILDIKVVRRRKKYLEAEIRKIHKASEHRTEAFCSHFKVCGGCKWQYLSYQAQLKLKQQQVIDHMQRIGKVEIKEVEPIIAADPQTYYRNKLEYSFANNGWRTKEAFDQLSDEEKQRDYNVLGFHVPGFFDKIVDIDHCYLQAEPSNELRLFIKKYAEENNYSFHNIRSREGFLRNIIIRTSSTGELMLNLVFNNNDKAKIEQLLNACIQEFPQLTSVNYFINSKSNDSYADLEAISFAGKPYIEEKMEDLRFRIAPKSFYQTNSKQAYALYSKAREYAALTGEEIVYDLYTGTGTIANFVAAKAKKVLGIEYVNEAVDDAAVNANTNKISNTHFISGDMAKVLNEELIAQFGAPDVVITDPPRAGMHPKVIEQLLKAKPQRIVYISCNTATQARDVSLLEEEYSMQRSCAIDMFPHTHHVENIMLLIRKND